MTLTFIFLKLNSKKLWVVFVTERKWQRSWLSQSAKNCTVLLLYCIEKDLNRQRAVFRKWYNQNNNIFDFKRSFQCFWKKLMRERENNPSLVYLRYPKLGLQYALNNWKKNLEMFFFEYQIWFAMEKTKNKPSIAIFIWRKCITSNFFQNTNTWVFSSPVFFIRIKRPPHLVCSFFQSCCIFAYT